MSCWIIRHTWQNKISILASFCSRSIWFHSCLAVNFKVEVVKWSFLTSLVYSICIVFWDDPTCKLRLNWPCYIKYYVIGLIKRFCRTGRVIIINNKHSTKMYFHPSSVKIVYLYATLFSCSHLLINIYSYSII